MTRSAGCMPLMLVAFIPLRYLAGRSGKRGGKASPSVSQLAAGDPRFRVIVSSTHQSEKVIQVDWTAVLFGSTPYSSTDALAQDACGAKAAAGEGPQQQQQQQQQQQGLEQQQGAAAVQEHVDQQVVDRVMQYNPALFPEIQQVRLMLRVPECLRQQG